MEYALQTVRAKKNPPPPSPSRAKEMEEKHGKTYGQPAIAGYQGHVGMGWRNREGEQMQNQLLLRVKPALRAQPARLRTNTEEADENSSDALKEAKAAWALILSNFAEFRKVQKAFRMVDKDFSGIISREELRHLIQNVLYIAVSDSAFDIIFNTMDSDHSGELTFDEFAAAISDPDIQLTEAVSDTAEAQTGLAQKAMYEEMLKKKDQKTFDTGPSRDLDGKYERLKIGDRAWTIQNLRKIIEKRFFEIRNSFVAEDPAGRGAVSREDFILLLRRNHIAPDGGEAAMESLIAALDPEGSGMVDYLAMLKAFESVDPRLRMADEKVAVKAAVQRKLHAADGAAQHSESGAGEGYDDEAEAVEAAFKKKRTDDQSTSKDRSKDWQQADRPGCPTAETRRAYQHRARQLGIAVAGDSEAPTARPHSPLFPVRQPRTGGTTGRPSSHGLDSGGGAKMLYGVELGRSKGGGSKGRENPLEGFSAAAKEAAREAWDLVRLASESAFGSAQKAFRSVDKDASNRIELGELRHLLTVHLNIDLEEEAVAVIFKCLDRGDKGNITYTEFTSALRAPLASAVDVEPATALEMEQHPLDPHYGKRLAGQRPPWLHVDMYDKALTKATQAGNLVLAKGASKAQYGDRYAWKAAMPYTTTTRQSIGVVGQLRLPAEPAHSPTAGGMSAGPLSLEKTARCAGVLFLEPPPRTDRSSGSIGYSPPSTGRRAGSPPAPPSPVHAKKHYGPLEKDQHAWSPAQAKEVSKIYYQQPTSTRR
jgi:Ca2+-binding EF-hand superfamily protein